MDLTTPKWWEVFPQGTEEGDEETRFFCALNRHKEYKYRTVDNLSEESQLSKARVEEIIAKYAPSGIILQNPKNPEMWGYWERVGSKQVDKDLLEEDHEIRLKKAKS
jgi:hypothetical protein